MSPVARPDGADPAPSLARFAASLLAGPLIWAGHFGLVYAVHHVACRASADPGRFVTPVMIGATIAAMLALAVATFGPGRLMAPHALPLDPPLRRFLNAVSRWLILLGAIGVLWTWSGFLFIPACVS